jgi:PAS domain S-box-containing protein
MQFVALKHFIEDAPIGAAMFDRDMRYVASSPRWLADHRIESIAPGQSHYDVFPELPRSWKDVHRRALAGETIREADDLFERVDGERIWLKWEARPWRDAEGAIGGIIIFTEDITPQKLAEAALLEALSRLRLAQSAGQIGIWDVDLRRSRTYVNDEWRDLFGLPTTGALDYGDFLARVHPEDRTTVEASTALARAGDAGVALDFRILRADNGALRWVSSKGEVHFNANGEPYRVLGAVYDITERKTLEQALREADCRRTAFLATLAHELRNPLTPISNAINVLLRMQEDDPPSREKKMAVVKMARRQVDHLAHLVDDLLDVARIDHGKIRLERKPLDLVALLPHVVEFAKPKLDAKGHLLTLEVFSEPLPIFGDPVRLAQVFSNILDNAACYTDPGGRIALTARRDGDDACVAVRDNGNGIPPEMLSKIFEMFVQVGDRNDTPNRGLGVGLALARNLVEMHDGHIEARSDGLGHGSEFRVRLPLARREESRGNGSDAAN